MDTEYCKRLSNCDPRNILIGRKGEDAVLEILIRQLPPGYTVEKQAPSLLSQGNCDYIVRDPKGKVVLHVEVKNWNEYPVSHKTVVEQVLKRVRLDSASKLLITSSEQLASRPELRASKWLVAWTRIQTLPTFGGKQLLHVYLVWKRAIVPILSELGLYHNPFLKNELPSLRKPRQRVFKTYRKSTHTIRVNTHWGTVDVIVDRINRLRLSLVDAFLHCASLDIFIGDVQP
jgi:Holliday junction resolvase-like predicted endonuclease